MMKDPFPRRDRLVLYDLCHQIRESNRQVIGTVMPKRHSQARLRIRVYQKYLLPGNGQSHTKVLTGGGLAGPAFLVRYCRNHGLIRQ